MKNYIAIEQRRKILGKASDGSILPQFSRVVNSRILVIKVKQSRIIFSFCLKEPRCSQHQTSDHFSFKDGILISVSLITFRLLCTGVHVDLCALGEGGGVVQTEGDGWVV